MPIYAGIDEAGYGPTLGPLTVTATAFEWKGDLDQARQSYSGLSQAFPRITDSKRVFTPKKGIQALEERVHTFFPVWFDTPPRTLSAFIELLTENGYKDVFNRSPWFTGDDLDIPVTKINAKTASDILNGLGVRSAYAVSRIINVPLFNNTIQQGFNKGMLLFSMVCSLLTSVMSKYENKDIRITVDRLGGRKFYKRLLLENFAASRIETLTETEQESEYLVNTGTRNVHIAFKVKADADDFCTGLSSLVSKYLRELCMHLFNGFFCSRSKGLKATQGYPQDARRFLKDIKGMVTGNELEHLMRLR
ncbi:hypothetical protein ACFL6F_02435 [Planctomycetota bacterium]